MIDDAVREALHRAARQAGAEPVGTREDFALLVAHRIAANERRAARNRRALVGALAAFVLVSGTVAYAVGRDGSVQDLVPAVPATPRTGMSGWASMAPSPLGPRADHHQIWTGSELLVFGGYGGADAERLPGMAAYDPAGGTWRALAQPPALRSEHAIWAEGQMLVLNVDSSLHGYDPSTDEWRDLAPSPFAGENRLLAWVWIGDGVLAVYKTSGGRAPVAVYDPEADSWRELPAVPVDLSSLEVIWTGAEVLAVGHSAGDRKPFPRLEAWSVQPGTGRWTELPRPPLLDAERRTVGIVSWTGAELVVGGGEHQTEAGAILLESGRGTDPTPEELQAITPRVARDVAAFDPRLDVWRTLPDAPVGVTGLEGGPEAWTGHEVLAWVADPTRAIERRDGRPALLDPATGEWRVVDAPAEGMRQGAPTTWTGKELLWWSGEPTVNDAAPSTCCFPAVPTGSSFTP